MIQWLQVPTNVFTNMAQRRDREKNIKNANFQKNNILMSILCYQSYLKANWGKINVCCVHRKILAALCESPVCHSINTALIRGLEFQDQMGTLFTKPCGKEAFFFPNDGILNNVQIVNFLEKDGIRMTF